MTTASDADQEASLDSGGKLRSLDGTLGRVVMAMAVVISLAHIWYNTVALLPDLTKSALHFAAFGVLCALVFPLTRAHGRSARIIFAIDVAIAAILVASVVYLLINEVPLANRGFDYGFWDYAAGTAIIVIAIEFTRRTTGWIIPIIIVAGLTYVVYWGRFVGGALNFPGLSEEVLLLRSTYNEDGMFGFIAGISSSFVFMFILFGAFLVKSGAGEFVINIARAAAGRMIGGPGFVAVLGSGLMGTISGSAVANTVSTGVITIPLMKRSGFPARFAAGVEASSSTGGQLMPPIMGAGAFVMANLTGISYLQIVAVAFLPAFLYFLGIAFYVRIEAKRRHLKSADHDAPKVMAVLRQGGIAFLLPIAVLIFMLVEGFTPTYAAGYAILAVVTASWLTPNRMGPRKILEALALGAHNMILTAILLVSVGLIVNVIATTGVGNTFSLMIAAWSGNSVLIAILLIAIASLVLGMGLPVTAAYIVLATLSAPALKDLILQTELVTVLAGTRAPGSLSAIFLLFTPDQLVEAAAAANVALAPEMAAALAAAVPAGEALTEAQAQALVSLLNVPDIAALAGDLQSQLLAPAIVTTALLSAHMIIFWLSQDSNVTPPVCLTAFAAAAIAGTTPMATGFTAWKIAKVLYIVPLLFAYTPFLSGDVAAALQIFGFGVLGVYAVIAAIEGHAEAPYPMFVRPALAAVGAALLWPGGLVLHIGAAAALIAFMVWNVTSGRRRTAEI